MAYRVRIFVDFWNFQLSWNDHLTSQKQCDWPRVPAHLLNLTRQALATAGITEPLALEETRVYASYNPSSPADGKLRDWLSNFLDRQPSFRVFSFQRKDKPAAFYCRECQTQFTACPSCGRPLLRSREKGVDAAIVTDLLSLAWENAYDVAVLVSSDADMIPCVERIQEKGFKVVNATWPRRGMDLARVCWACFDILPSAGGLIRDRAVRP